MTIVYEVPDDLPQKELFLLQSRLAAQKGPSEIYLQDTLSSKLVAPRVYTVSTPERVI